VELGRGFPIDGNFENFEKNCAVEILKQNVRYAVVQAGILKYWRKKGTYPHLDTFTYIHKNSREHS
jgi:hypothetical protein